MDNKQIETFSFPDIDEIIFLADIHWGVKGDSIEWVENISNYFNDFFIPLLIEENKSHNPIVVIAGDYFDNRNHIEINVMNCAYKIIEKISKITSVIMMKGNHDIYKRIDTDVSSLMIFENINNVYIIDDIAVLSNATEKVLLVSWVGDIKEENKIISKYKDLYDLLVFHTELSGMTYDNNKPILNGLNLSTVTTCKILSGHIHKRQEGKKGLYFGSPYQMTRSDIGNEKGVYIYDISDVQPSRRFVKNDYSPKFIKAVYSEHGRDPEQWKDIVSNNYVDIVFEEDEVEKININNFIEDISVYNPKKIELMINKRSYSIIDSSSEEKIDSSVAMNGDLEYVFNDRISKLENPLNKTEIKKINKMNEEYVKRAMEELNR